MKKSLLWTLALVFTFTLKAQEKDLLQSHPMYVDLGIGIGQKSQIINAAIHKTWALSKDKKGFKNMYIGTGFSLGAFMGKDRTFVSAPPKLYADANLQDTILAPTPYIFSGNLFIDLGYTFSPKFAMGFNLDAIGFSFGPKGEPTFIQNGVETKQKVSPTAFNILLVGANDIGTLHGGLYARYAINKRWTARATFHTLFTELTTDNTVQTVPEENKRFRHSANFFGLGVSYAL